jgi:cell division protein FtsQ
MRQRARLIARALVGAMVLVLTSGAFIFAYDYFTQTRHFRANRIEVTGQVRLGRQQILEIAGVGPHTNILAVNLTTTRKRLLDNPWIAEATVSREIPSALQIHIREEMPLALLEMPDGQGFLINVAGQVFKRQAGSVKAAMPRVSGLDYADLPVSGKPSTKTLRSMTRLLRQAGKKGSPLPLADIERVHMDPEIGATVHTSRPARVVKLGFGRYAEKCEALGQVTEQLRRDHRLTRCRVIDLLDINRIVVTLAPIGSTESDLEEV